MAQQVLNNPDNTGIAHGVSVWFQDSYTGTYRELGDVVAAAINLAPEFVEHYSYRNGLRGLRKKILTKRSATVNITLYEPNVLNLQRVLYGGTIDTDVDDVVIEEARIMTLATSGGNLVVDFDAIDETDYTTAGITVKGVYALTDITFSDNLIASDVTPDASTGVAILGTSPLGQSASSGGPVSGDEVYVHYQIASDNMMSTELFGASDATIEGAAKLQVRNQNGGVMQLWHFSSVQLSSNGDIGYPLDAEQTLPISMSLLERNGTFGTVYAK